MDEQLKAELAAGRYRVDADAVALAMIMRARALRRARHVDPGLGVFVPSDEIEIRRGAVSDEPQQAVSEAGPLDGAAALEDTA